MSLYSRLERIFGRWAIPNLTLVLIAGQAVLYIAALLPEGMSLDAVTLDPARVMQGEVWRLVTFLFMPPNTDILWVLFYFLLLNMFGSTLEQQWGVFRFNLYLFIGYAANIAAAFAASAMLGQTVAASPDEVSRFASISARNHFLYASIFLAFARLYPDFIINLFFVLPIRIKWLALTMWLMFGYAFVRGGVPTRMMVGATVLNYLVFFGREHWRELRQGRRRRSFRASAARVAAAPAHECRVCGLSTEDSAKTLFRYCSKCEGQCCYCPAHIRDHEHVTAEKPAAP